jgi:hypothetical protein
MALIDLPETVPNERLEDPFVPSAKLRRRVGIALPPLICIGLCAHELITAHAFGGVYDYDDGVYFGAAVRLAHGAMPYRDFVFVHPPGIALLLAPLALLGRVIGTSDALGVARLLTAVVSVGNVMLVGALFRKRSALGAFIASLVLAVIPFAVAADNTVLLEPYFVAFVLLAMLVVFTGDLERESQAAFVAGVLFGIAVSIKLWAAIPLLGTALVLSRRQLLRLAAGAVAGTLVVSGPFVATAPREFWRDVVVAQLDRPASGNGAIGINRRLAELANLYGLPHVSVTETVGAAIGIGIGALIVIAAVAGRRRMTRFDLAVLLSSALSVAAVLAAREFYPYYTYLPLVFVAVSFGSLCATVRFRLPASFARFWRWRAAGRGFALVLIGALVYESGAFGAQYLGASRSLQPAAAIDAVIPAGSCVVFDQPTIALVANRYLSASPSCPALVDPFGIWLVQNGAALPPYSGPYAAEFTNSWSDLFSRADYAVIQSVTFGYIPWSIPLRNAFLQRFQLVDQIPGAYVYRRSG